MQRSFAFALVSLAIAGCSLALGLLTLSMTERPGIEVRFKRRHGLTGRLVPGCTVGQGFRCESSGLWRIDVAAQQIVDRTDDRLVLTLREGGPEGEELRRATANAELDADDGFVGFEFDPIEASRGREFWFTLESSDEAAPGWALWWRWRGPLVDDRPWGDRELAGDSFEASFRARYADLSALLVPVAELDPGTDPPRIELTEQDTGTTLVAHQQPVVPIRGGHACFPFPPQASSRARTYDVRVHLPEGSKLIAGDDGPSFQTVYGAGWAPAGPLGMSLAGTPARERDVVFRAWTRRSLRRDLEVLGDRAGRRGAVGIAAWIAALLVLGVVCVRRMSS